MTGQSRKGNELGFWWYVGRLIVGFLFRITLGIRAIGADRVPSTGAVLIALNHISVLDPVTIGLLMAKRGRRIGFLTAAEFFEHPFVGRGLRLVDQIPIRRGAADWDALNEVAGIIRRGRLGGIFPEGRVTEATVVQPGRKGVARIALTAGVPVIPVGIWGTHERWGQRGFNFGRPFRPTVAVVFGEPIPPEGDSHNRADVRALTDRIMADITVLVGRAQRICEPPPARRGGREDSTGEH
jgi:1-acyl-sn-glycerol-3-phosphate acyltransferase